MKHSDALGAIGTALAAANKEMKSISKDKTNPQYNTKYVTLDQIIENVRPLLAKYGLSIVQGASTPHTDTDGMLTALTIETMLLHESGEWLCAAIVLPVGTKPVKSGNEIVDYAPTAQTAGATLTYGRRYGLAMFLSIASDDDDDGNKASEHGGKRKQSAPPPPETKSASARVVTALDRLPTWKGYDHSGVMLVDAPIEELERLYKWEPSTEEKRKNYAPMKEAIGLEMERRRLDAQKVVAHPLAKSNNDDLPF